MLEAQIKSMLGQTLSPTHLAVVNESHMHSVPKNSETHFKVVVVADAFVGQTLVARHRSITQLLSEQFKAGLHALALHTYTPEEWEKKNQSANDSPKCLGGSKHG